MRDDPWRASAATALGWLAVLLVAVGGAAFGALHVLEPNVDPLHRMLSDYGDTVHRLYLTLAELTIGAAGVVAGVALVLRDPGHRATRTGTSMLALAGGTILGLAVWPDGIVHIGLVRAGQGIMLLAVGAFALGSRERGHLRVFGALSWTLLVLTAMGILRMEWLTPWPALVQRLYWGVLASWIVAGARAATRPLSGTLRAPSSSRS